MMTIDGRVAARITIAYAYAWRAGMEFSASHQRSTSLLQTKSPPGDRPPFPFPLVGAVRKARNRTTGLRLPPTSRIYVFIFEMSQLAGDSENAVSG